MNTNPIAIRVARRHRAAMLLRNVPTTKTHVEYTSGGIFSAVDLMRMLEPQFGYFVKLRFRPAPAGPQPTTITWEATTESADVVTGTLVLHAAVDQDEVTTWAVLTIDGV